MDKIAQDIKDILANHAGDEPCKFRDVLEKLLAGIESGDPVKQNAACKLWEYIKA